MGRASFKVLTTGAFQCSCFLEGSVLIFFALEIWSELSGLVWSGLVWSGFVWFVVHARPQLTFFPAPINLEKFSTPNNQMPVYVPPKKTKPNMAVSPPFRPSGGGEGLGERGGRTSLLKNPAPTQTTTKRIAHNPINTRARSQFTSNISSRIQHPPRLNGDAARTAAGNGPVVRHQHQRGTQLPVEVKHQLHHLFARGKVQAAGGLVGQKHGGLDHKRARQCHALLLATTQDLGVVTQSLGQPHAGEHLGGGGAGVAPIRQLQRQHDIFQGREVAQQLKALKYKTQFLSPQGSAGVFVDGEDILPCQSHSATAGCVQPGDDGQERAFAGARRADDSHCFPCVQGEINIAQNVERAGGIRDRFENVLYGNN